MTSRKLGADCWNQYTDWPSLPEAGVRLTWTSREATAELMGARGEGRRRPEALCLARRWRG